MPEEKSNSKIPIIIAIITVVGSLIVAIINKWDFSSKPKQDSVSNQTKQDSPSGSSRDLQQPNNDIDVINLPSLTTETSVNDGVRESDALHVKASVTAWVKFQYTNGKTYYEIRGYNDSTKDYSYHLEVELTDQNGNTIKEFKTSEYELKGSETRNHINFKDELPEIDKSEKVKVKNINSKLYFD